MNATNNQNIIRLSKPTKVSDSSGNVMDVREIAFDLSINNGQVIANPNSWNIRDGVTRLAGYDPFTINAGDDPTIQDLFGQLIKRSVEIVTERVNSLK